MKATSSTPVWKARLSPLFQVKEEPVPVPLG
jgi:hypothetical protein